MPYEAGMWGSIQREAMAHLQAGDLSRAMAFLDFALRHVLRSHEELTADDKSALSDTGTAHTLMAGAFMASRRVGRASEHLNRATAAFTRAGESIVTHADDFSQSFAWRGFVEAYSERRHDLEPQVRATLLDFVDAVTQRQAADAWLLAVRGLLYRELGRADEAVRALEAAHAASPAEARIARALAQLHIEAGRTAAARDVLNALAAANGRDGETLLLLAEADAREERWPEAIESYRSARAVMPDSSDARIGLARALMKAGRPGDALAMLDEAEALGRRADEWALRAEVLMGLERWDEAGESLMSAHTAGLDPETEGRQYLELARRLYASGRLAEADAALDLAEGVSVPADDVVDFRLQILSGLERWDDMRKCAEDALARRDRDERLTTARARALRNLKRHEEALEAMLALPAPTEVPSVRLLAVLKCEVGDFLGALETVQPRTQDRAAAEPELLGIEGWAHQNCGGADHAREAEEVYRAALLKRPGDPWYHKGLANALRHQQRVDDARREYREVIRMAAAAQEDQLTGAFLTCLTGWCHYCLGEFDRAADCYAAGLAVAPVGIACQFDHGLVLLAGGFGAAAAREYQRTFKEIGELSALRRCGLLYVALVDLRDAPSILPALADSPDAALIRAEIRARLEQAANELPEAFAGLAKRMRQLANADAVASPADLQATPAALTARQDWREFEVIGGDASGGRGSGILMPVVTRWAEPDVFQVLHPTGLGEPFDGRTLMRGVQDGTIVRLPVEARASLGARVLVVTHDLLEKANLATLAEMDTGVEWYRVGEPAAGFVSCATALVGERLFDALGRRLIARVIDAAKAIVAAADPAATQGEAGPEGRQAAGYAVDVVCDPEIAYQAVLAYALAGGNHVEASARIATRRPPAAEVIQRQARWTETIVAFRRLLAVAARTDADREDERARAAKELAGLLLQRAREVASLADSAERDSRALCAALEVQALTRMTPALEAQRAALEKRLESQAHVTLDLPESVLLMAAKPAFYSPAVVNSENDKPARVNVFAYTRRIREGDRSRGGMVKHASSRR